MLNDDGEYRYGMYLAAGYQYLYEIQNEFLTAIQNSIQLNLRLFHLKNNFKGNRITVQHAKPFQVIDISPVKFGSRKNLEGLIFNHCYLNFLNFSDVEFNYEALEKELSGILIQGKKLFSDEQNFIVYAYEVFRRNNSAIILNFSKRIPQKQINQNEKFTIKNYLESHNSNMKKGEKLLSTLTSMIFYL